MILQAALFKKVCEAKMAFVSTSRAVRVTLTDRIAAVFTVLREANQRRSVYAQTYRELSGLTDRELTDLGIARHEIADLSRQAAYGA